MLNQPVAWVTGSSRGIGQGIAWELAERGFAVVVHYHRQAQAAQETAARMTGPVLLCQGDVTLATDRAQMLGQILEKWGRIDVLVNNAGIAPPERLDVLETTEANWDAVLATNLKGPFFLTQAVAQTMIERRTTIAEPAIINIGSISATTASTNRGEYCIAKAGVAMLTQLWAVRLAPHGIRVHEVRPGIIATDMTAAVKPKYDQLLAAGRFPISRWGEPRDVGRAVALLASGALPYSTGDVLHVDGGFHITQL